MFVASIIFLLSFIHPMSKQKMARFSLDFVKREIESSVIARKFCVIIFNKNDIELVEFRKLTCEQYITANFKVSKESILISKDKTSRNVPWKMCQMQLHLHQIHSKYRRNGQ